MDDEAGQGQHLAAELTRALETWHLSNGDPGWTARVRHLVRLLKADGSWAGLVGDWKAADRDGDADAALRLSWALAEQGDQAGYRETLDRAARRGHPAAWWIRRTAQARPGDDTGELETAYERARQEYRRADEAADRAGDAEAARHLGAQLLAGAAAARQAGDHQLAARHTEQGVAALHRAVERGSAEAAALLGALAVEESPYLPEADEDRDQRALRWYQLADERGHAHAAWQVGRILSARGDLAGAENAYRRAQARGDAWAVSSLAALLSRRDPPDPAGAEAGYRLAAEIEYVPDAYTELGAFLRERGDLVGAEAAFQRAVERGERNAATYLRYLYQHHPGLREKP